MCYHCLENVDTDEECTAETPYNFIGLEDPESNDRRIECRKFYMFLYKVVDETLRKDY